MDRKQLEQKKHKLLQQRSFQTHGTQNGMSAYFVWSLSFFTKLALTIRQVKQSVFRNAQRKELKLSSLGEYEQSSTKHYSMQKDALLHHYAASCLPSAKTRSEHLLCAKQIFYKKIII